jgi:hypothetical protein
MTSNIVPDTEDEFFTMLDLIAKGRKHYAESGHIKKGRYYPNGRRQSGTRNAGQRTKYYVEVKTYQTGLISAPKEFKSPVKAKPPRYRPSKMVLSPIQEDVMPISERVALAHATTESTTPAPEKKLIDLTISRNGKRGKEVWQAVEVEGDNVASWWEDSSSSSSSSSESESDEAKVGTPKRRSLKRAFGLLPRKERPI